MVRSEIKIEQQFEPTGGSFGIGSKTQKRKSGFKRQTIRRFEQKNGIRPRLRSPLHRTMDRKPAGLGARYALRAARSRATWRPISIRAALARSRLVASAPAGLPMRCCLKSSTPLVSCSSSSNPTFCRLLRFALPKAPVVQGRRLASNRLARRPDKLRPRRGVRPASCHQAAAVRLRLLFRSLRSIPPGAPSSVHLHAVFPRSRSGSSLLARSRPKRVMDDYPPARVWVSRRDDDAIATQRRCVVAIRPRPFLPSVMAVRKFGHSRPPAGEVYTCAGGAREHGTDIADADVTAHLLVDYRCRSMMPTPPRIRAAAQRVYKLNS